MLEELGHSTYTGNSSIGDQLYTIGDSLAGYTYSWFLAPSWKKWLKDQKRKEKKKKEGAKNFFMMMMVGAAVRQKEQAAYKKTRQQLIPY